MKNFAWLSLLSCVAFVIGCGAGEEADSTASDAAGGTEVAEATTFCTDCGFAKGDEECCDESAEACTDCGFHKGADLCCVGLKQADVAGKQFCNACGFVAGSEKCCEEGAEVCSACNLHKGSDLCCKVKGDDAHAHEHAEGDHAKHEGE